MKTGILCTKSFLNSAQKPIYSASNNLLHMRMKKEIPLIEEDLVTGATFNGKSSHFILNCFSEGKVANEKFRKERLEIRSTKLFDAIPKSRPSFKNGKP